MKALTRDSRTAVSRRMIEGNTEDESEGSAAAQLIVNDGDVEGRTERKSQGDKEEKVICG